MLHNIGAYQKHVRKRMQENLEQYPHPDKWKNSWDKIMYFMAIIVPLITTAQAVKIWTNHDASGVSLIVWSTYLVSSAMWLIYGILHKENPIILNNIICVLINVPIVVGTVMYG